MELNRWFNSGFRLSLMFLFGFLSWPAPLRLTGGGGWRFWVKIANRNGGGGGPIKSIRERLDGNWIPWMDDEAPERKAVEGVKKIVIPSGPIQTRRNPQLSFEVLSNRRVTQLELVPLIGRNVKNNGLGNIYGLTVFDSSLKGCASGGDGIEVNE